MTKIKEFFSNIKEKIQNWWDGLMSDWAKFSWEHPGVAGHLEGTFLVYWLILLSVAVVSLIKRKRYVYKLMPYDR